MDKYTEINVYEFLILNNICVNLLQLVDQFYSETKSKNIVPNDKVWLHKIYKFEKHLPSSNIF